MQGNGPKRLQLSATGPCDVTAGMIAAAGDIEIMNPKHAICHLDQGATLNMELTADIGKGYVAAAANRPADAPIGLIPVDALAYAATGRYRDRASPDIMPPADGWAGTVPRGTVPASVETPGPFVPVCHTKKTPCIYSHMNIFNSEYRKETRNAA